MQFNQETASIFVPDGLPAHEALSLTTHMGIGAHPDDLEIMAAAGILDCYQHTEKWFCGVILTDGSGSPRSGPYASFTDAEMQAVRHAEQRKAAVIGEYGALVSLDYPSTAVKDGTNSRPVEDLIQIIRVAQPQVVYTHNLADKHDTHVAVALRVITALRALPQTEHPQACYGCEIWRDLDWLLDSDKVSFDLSQRENLQAALLGVFDSQISGGKRYDLAALGRRRANATFGESHATDTNSSLSYAMDLTPLIQDGTIDPRAYVVGYIERLKTDVQNRIAQMGG